MFSRALPYLLSPALVAVATRVLLEMQRLLSDRPDERVRPFSIGFVLVIALVTVLGGWAPGALTLLLSLAATIFFLMEPYGSFRVSHGSDALETLALVTVGGLVLLAIEGARRAAEQARVSLAASEAARRAADEARVRLQTFFDTVPLGVLTTDAAGVLTYANRETERLWGRPLAAMESRFWEIADVRDAEGGEIVPAERRTLGRALAGETGVLEAEYFFARPDGGGAPVFVQSTSVRDPNGNLLGGLSLLTDLTERRRGEEERAERARLNALRADVNNALVRNEPLPDVLHRCVEAVVTHLDAAFARVWTLNTAENVLELRASAGRYTHLDGPHGRVPVGQFKIGLIAQERRPHLTNQVVGDPRVSDQEWARREKMVAFAGYPLVVDDRLLGVVALFARHPLSDATLEALAPVANDIALGLERRAAEEALRASEQRFRTLVEQTAQIIWTNDAEGRMTGEQIGWAAFTGQTFDDYQGYGWSQAVHPEDAKPTIDAWEKAVAARRVFAFEHRVRRRDGAWRTCTIRAVPILEPNGAIREWVGVHTDVTERKQAEAEAERLLKAERLTNRIAVAQRGSLDPQAVQRVAVEALGQALDANRCYLIEYDVAHDRASIRGDWHRANLASLEGDYRLSDFRADPEKAYAGKTTLVIPDVRAHPATSEAAAAYEALGARAAIFVPLYDENQRLAAALSVNAGAEPRDWTPDEVALVEAVAAQTHSTMNTARLIQRDRTIAERLQDALRPSLPEGVPGLDLQDHYRAALSEANVGGDFFDVFSVEKGCVALVVGDLSGKGLAAASQVSLVRNMLRFALYNGRTIANALADLNRTLADQELLVGFATLFAGVYDAGALTLTYVSCGHEPALLRRARTRVVEELAATGPVLGAFAEAAYTERVVALAEGDALAIYTDGLSEAGRNRRQFLGVEGLTRLLEEGGETALALKDHIVQGVRAHANDDLHDDTCLLVAVVKAAGARDATP